MIWEVCHVWMEETSVVVAKKKGDMCLRFNKCCVKERAIFTLHWSKIPQFRQSIGNELTCLLGLTKNSKSFITFERKSERPNWIKIHILFWFEIMLSQKIWREYRKTSSGVESFNSKSNKKGSQVFVVWKSIRTGSVWSTQKESRLKIFKSKLNQLAFRWTVWQQFLWLEKEAIPSNEMRFFC